MIWKARITRSCIYWADDKRETTDFEVEAENRTEAEKLIHQKAMRMEFSTGSKLVQDILIEIDGEFKPI